MAKKQKLRVFVSANCGPCQEIKEAINAGRFNAEEVDLIDIETEEGFPWIKKLGLTKAPSAYLGRKECEMFINREDNSLYIDCPTSKKPPRIPENAPQPS
jgi:glutaredoxin